MKNAKKRTDPKFANSQKGKKKMKNILNKYNYKITKKYLKKCLTNQRRTPIIKTTKQKRETKNKEDSPMKT